MDFFKKSSLLRIFHQSLDCDVEGAEFVHLFHGPHPALSVPPHEGALVAAFAKSYHAVLKRLLNVVGIGRAGRVTHRAGQQLYPGYVCALLRRELVVHPLLSTLRLPFHMQLLQVHHLLLILGCCHLQTFPAKPSPQSSRAGTCPLFGSLLLEMLVSSHSPCSFFHHCLCLVKAFFGKGFFVFDHAVV